MTDSIVSQIERSVDPALEQSRQILHDVRCRRLYKVAGEVVPIIIISEPFSRPLLMFLQPRTFLIVPAISSVPSHFIFIHAIYVVRAIFYLSAPFFHNNKHAVLTIFPHYLHNNDTVS
jgi:hypothetical protein